MLDYPRGELALLSHRMNHEKSARLVSTRRARKIVDIKARDRGGDDARIAIDHRMMQERDVEVSHFCGERAGRGGAYGCARVPVRRAMRECAHGRRSAGS